MSHEVNPLFILREERAKGNEDFTYEDAVDAAKLRSMAQTPSTTSATSTPAGGPASPGLWDRLKGKWNSPEMQKLLEDVMKPGQLGAGSPLAPNMGPAEMLRMGKVGLAAAPYASPAGAGRSVATTAARAFLPMAMGIEEAASPGTSGNSAENAVGATANAVREFAGGKLMPKVPPGIQGILAGGLEGILGSAAQQGVDTGSVDPGQATKSGALNAFFNLLPGYVGKGGRDNAVTGRSNVLENSPFSRFNTAGVKKDFGEIQKSTDNYLQSLERTKKGGTAAPQDYIARKFYREAGFNDSPEDISLLKRLRDNPDETISDVMGKALNFDPDKTLDVNIVKMNRQLNKVVDLFGKSKSSEVLKDKAGEIIVSSFLSPAADSPRNVKRMFEKLEKGGDSAFDKIFTPEQKTALFKGVEATQKIKEVATATTNLRMGYSGGQLWMALPGTGVLFLSPTNVATAVLHNPNKSAVMQDVANMFERAAKNPLSGGRIPRAIVDKLKDAFGATERPENEQPGKAASISSLLGLGN